MSSVVLPGSERASVPGSRILGPADPLERLEVSVLVRGRQSENLRARVASVAAGESAAPMSREQFAEQHGADDADFAAIRNFATGFGLVVVSEHAARRTLVLAGTVTQFCKAFAVTLHRMEHPNGTFRGRTGAIHVPPPLQDIVETVLGLDDRPQAMPHYRMRRAGSSAMSYTPLQVAEAYGYPAGAGAGECVALIELGGGFRPADLKVYFSALGVGAPSVVAISVDHAKNAPSSASGPDGEVMLDIEVVGAIAPEARIAVYFAPNTDAGFLDAVTTAIHDTVHRPSVISISWGGPESSWTAQAMTAMDAAFREAAALGITVCVASGDNGSSDGVAGGGAHVDFPASSSFVLACGGTRLPPGAAASDESVWNDGSVGGASGGGISTFFATPSWQQGLRAPRASGAALPLALRGVPDVAGDADPETGYRIRVDGSDTVIGGTSAVAPLWAALIARINGAQGTSAGFVNPRLYAAPRACRDITSGNNGNFAAGVGWDACTGLGSPNGSAVAEIV